jgi:tRNA nucleotidyltransferase (CCA-adding enzyme)
MSDVRVHPPQAVLEIAAALEAAGHETWCVGGAVRDALLGTSDLDWDLTTAAAPTVVRRLFPRTVPVGIEHGTVGVFGSDGRLHEVTTFRADVETDGRHAVVRFGVSLDEDLARRDFTINAMAWSPSRQELRDPFRGRDDLDAKCIRAVGDAAQRMAEDRLRALRAIRFAARFAFTIDAETWLAIVGSAPNLPQLSVERVLQEWTKTNEQVRCPSAAFAMWRESGALRVLIPGLADVRDEYFVAIDHVPRGGLTTRVERTSLRALTRLALPFVALGGPAAKAALTQLRASNSDIAFAAAIADSWAQYGTPLERAAITPPEPVLLRRIVAGIGRTRVHGTIRAFAAIWAARRAVGHSAPSTVQVMRLARQMLRVAYADPIALSDLAVTGDDLRAAGIRPGPALGRILHTLLDWVLDDPTRNAFPTLIEMARTLSQET